MSTENNLTLSGINPQNFETEGLASFNSGLETIACAHVPTKLYTLTNKNGMEVCFTNVGARIVSIMVPDKNNKMTNVSLGFDKISDYVNYNEDSGNYYGAVIGRYANRIAYGKVEIDGVEYQLSTNEKGNTLHGGSIGFNYMVFEKESVTENSLCLKYVSQDGVMGFPGDLTLKVTYTLSDDNAIGVYYEATTTKATPINFTNHAYFILSGDVNHPITQDKLFIVSNQTTEITDDLTPNGNINDIKVGGVFDFFGKNGEYYNTNGRTVENTIDKENQQFNFAGGYDHNFIIMSVAEAIEHGFDNKREFSVATDNSEELNKGARLAAIAYCPDTGIKLEIVTTEPGMQFFDCNPCDGTTVGMNGPFNKYCAFALETQHYPDSPHHPHFPNTILRPGEKFRSKSQYKFSVE